MPNQSTLNFTSLTSRLHFCLAELRIPKLLLPKIFYDQKVLVCFKPKLDITRSKWILEGGEELCSWCEEENRACEEERESEKMWRGGGVGSGRKTPPRCLNFDFARWRLPFTLVLCCYTGSHVLCISKRVSTMFRMHGAALT